MRRSSSLQRRATKSFVEETPQEQEERESPVLTSNPMKDRERDGTNKDKETSSNIPVLDASILDEDDDVEETQKLFCCGGNERILGFKVRYVLYIHEPS